MLDIKLLTKPQLTARLRQTAGPIGPLRPLTEQLVASGYHIAAELVAQTLAALQE